MRELPFVFAWQRSVAIVGNGGDCKIILKVCGWQSAACLLMDNWSAIVSGFIDKAEPLNGKEMLVFVGDTMNDGSEA